MADVFISYARTDRSAADKLAAVFRSAGASVWYDTHIELDDNFIVRIERELASASRVVVLWSAAARDSRWVCDEAGEALKRGALVQASLDGHGSPLGFGRHSEHLTDLSRIDALDWSSRAERFARGVIQMGQVPARPTSGKLHENAHGLRRFLKVGLTVLGIIFAALLVLGQIADKPKGKEKTTEKPTTSKAQDTLAHRVQRELKRLDCYSGAIDGIFGPKSTSGLEYCARRIGIPTPSVDATTLSTLRKTDRLPPVKPPSGPSVTPNPEPQQPVPVASSCRVTIAHSLVPWLREPGPFAADQGSVPPGQYSVFRHQWVSFGPTQLVYYQIRIGSQTGWIEASSWSLESRSSGCP